MHDARGSNFLATGHRIVAGLLSLLLSATAMAQETLFVYGPGGPAPAMKEAAAVFEKQHGTKVGVTAGLRRLGWRRPSRMLTLSTVGRKP